MPPRGGGRGEVSRRGSAALLVACATRLYGALLVLYPKAFRRRYGGEMRRDFLALSREGLEQGGAKELARVWTGALWDLAITALAERSTVAGRRNANYSSADPRMAARAMAAVVLVAVVVTVASLLLPPPYEASALVMADQKEQSAGKIQPIPNEPPPEEQAAQWMAGAIDSRPVAEEAIRRLRLRMTPDELLADQTGEQVDSSRFIRLTYTDTDPGRAAQVANAVGLVSSERVSVTSGGGTA